MKKERVNIQNLKIYNELIQKMRSFFQEKGFIEVATQPNLTILSACENPHSVASYSFDGSIWPLPQTGQMILEEVLLNNPEIPGCYCISTSYRDEKTPIPNRHKKLFNMFEVETKGTKEDMVKLQAEMLDYLGFDVPTVVDYNELCEKYGTEILEAEHETKMWSEIGDSISLQNFPLRTNPFWNMQKGQGDKFQKVDVILFGQETIGSAERSCDPESMKEMFYTIEGGNYSAKLFELFGKERVEKELEEFLSLDFFPRFGWGCGMTRLARAYEMNLQKKLSVELS